MTSKSVQVCPLETRPPAGESERKCTVLLWLFKGGFKVSLGTPEWYRSSYCTDFDTSEIASPVVASVARRRRSKSPRPGLSQEGVGPIRRM